MNGVFRIFARHEQHREFIGWSENSNARSCIKKPCTLILMAYLNICKESTPQLVEPFPDRCDAFFLLEDVLHE